MKIDSIIDALDFYSINNTDYRQKCYECVDSINNKNQNYIVDKIYNILYFEKIDSKKEQIKLIENLLQTKIHPFVTNILVLLGYNIHKNNFIKYNLDSSQIYLHKKRVKERLLADIYERGYEGLRIDEMVFTSCFINIKLIEVGRLQFEYAKINPINNVKEDCIKIHIPKGDKLNIEDVIKSINNSRRLIKRSFDLDYYEYYCKSWLLSKQIKQLIDSTSNIYKFQNLFNIIEGKSCLEDILNFVFNIQECKDFNDLPENTHLQIKIKESLLNNETFKLGIGTLK